MSVVAERRPACIREPASFYASQQKPRWDLINALEKEVNSKMALVKSIRQKDWYGESNDARFLRASIADAVELTDDVLNTLLTDLEAVYAKLGIPWTVRKSPWVKNLKEAILQISELISHHCVSSKAQYWYEDEGEYKIHCSPDLPFKIRYLIDSYQEIAANKSTLDSILKIQYIEQEHTDEKLAAEAEGKLLDPSISKKYIEEQLELVKALPVEGLLSQVKELTDKISSINKHMAILAGAYGCVISTCDAFSSYKQMKLDLVKGSGSGRERLSVLNQAIDSLLHTVDSFKNRWNTHYAAFFNSYCEFKGISNAAEVEEKEEEEVMSELGDLFY